MKKFFRKTLSIFTLAIVGLVIMTNLALASSYDITFSFDANLTGETRYFDGQNISFEAHASSYPEPHKSNKTYTVTLYRM